MNQPFLDKDFFTADNGTLIADASDLGLRPGYVPPNPVVVLFADERVERFYYWRIDKHAGDITGWRFVNRDNRELVIAND